MCRCGVAKRWCGESSNTRDPLDDLSGVNAGRRRGLVALYILAWQGENSGDGWTSLLISLIWEWRVVLNRDGKVYREMRDESREGGV